MTTSTFVVGQMLKRGCRFDAGDTSEYIAWICAQVQFRVKRPHMASYARCYSVAKNKRQNAKLFLWRSRELCHDLAISITYSVKLL
jgi:hypothetical protein